MIYRLAIKDPFGSRELGSIEWPTAVAPPPGFRLMVRVDSIERELFGVPDFIAEFRVERESVWPPREQLELFDWYPYLQTGPRPE